MKVEADGLYALYFAGGTDCFTRSRLTFSEEAFDPHESKTNAVAFQHY